MRDQKTLQIGKRVGKRPTIDELTARIKQRSRMRAMGSSAKVIRKHRDAG
jgi:hypothetical protein